MLQSNVIIVIFFAFWGWQTDPRRFSADTSEVEKPHELVRSVLVVIIVIFLTNAMPSLLANLAT